VRSDDSGLDSPKAQRPRGRSIGHGWGVDKGDEFFMQSSGVLAPDLSDVVSPRRDPDPFLVRGSSRGELNQCLPSLFARSLLLDPSSRSLLLTTSTAVS